MFAVLAALASGGGSILQSMGIRRAGVFGDASRRLPVAVIAFYAKRRNRSWAAPALAFGAGLGFSVMGISARSLTVPEPAWQLILEPSTWSIVLNGLAAG